MPRTSRTQRHLVNYHNPDSMGFEFDSTPTFAIVTNKNISRTGDRVWMIGRRSKTRDFYLYGVFRIERVERSDGDFKYQVSASRGEWIVPGERLNDLEWFPMFKKSMANFSLGFQPISNTRAIAALQKLRKKRGEMGMPLA